MPIGDIPVNEQGSRKDKIVAIYYIYLITGTISLILAGATILDSLKWINLSEGAYTFMLFFEVGILLHLLFLTPFAIVIIIKYRRIPKLTIPAIFFTGAMLCFGLWHIWLQKQPEQAYDNTLLYKVFLVLFVLYACSATVAGYLGTKEWHQKKITR